MKWTRWSAMVAGAGIACVVLAACGGGGSGGAGGASGTQPLAVGSLLSLSLDSTSQSAEFAIHVLSNRADLISGGQALIEISPANPSLFDRIDLDGRDVKALFALRPNGRYQGIVDGLKAGANVLTARTRTNAGASITITNHPIGGPVISGPQVEPWVCQTEAAGLGPAQDARCNAPAKVTYLYKSSNPLLLGLQPYDPNNPPLDVGVAMTEHAGAVPFIVRWEKGVVNRGIYEFLVLADPMQEPKPWQPRNWNGKLYWHFGGGCGPNHVQPSPYNSVLDSGSHIVDALAKGFATASSGLTNMGTNCNNVIAAETVMMLKEHITETLGPITYTMSQGGSGGSMQQHFLVSNYPGLLDGIQPGASFPDMWKVYKEGVDCHLLNRYFDQISPALWAVAVQQDAVTGFAASSTCREWVALFTGNWIDPTKASACGLPADQVYHPQTNPRGVRCTLQDYMAAIFGRRSSDGFANHPFDNTGVQYGLVALNSSLILPEQFVDLNEKVGGIDVDGKPNPGRSHADAAAIRTMHRAGLVVTGKEAAKVPILDLRATSNYDVHTDVGSYQMRARLQKANGHSDNQIIWSYAIPMFANPTGPLDGSLDSTAESFDLLNTWLAGIHADKSSLSLEEKVRINKPASAVDACWIDGIKITDMQKCRALLPYYSNPRMTAGAPLADDIVRCELKPLNRADYTMQFTDSQWERLQRAFPGGVCDYTKPGVEQQPSLPWMNYSAGPGGVPLGSAPVSVALKRN